MNEKTITPERDILTHLIKRLFTSYKIKNKLSSIKDEINDMAGAIRYINFSGDYEIFDERKEKTKAIYGHKGIIKYLTKEVEIPTEDEAENYEDKIKIYEGKSKAWYFLIISLADIPFGLARQ